MRRDGVFLGLIILYAVVVAGLFLARPWYANANIEKVTLVKGQVSPVIDDSNVSTIASEINSRRMATGVKPLVDSAMLDVLAGRRVSDMASRQYYSHTSPEGKTYADELPAIGLTSTGFSCENLLLTTETDPKKIVAEWQASESHNRCMRDARISYVGVSIARYDASLHYAGGSKPTYVIAAIHAEKLN